MAKLLKLRRGTTSQHSSFTGAEGEVTIDTTKDTAVVHDGSQAGGRPLAREDMNNVSSASIAGRLGTDSIATSKIAGGALPTDVTVASANIVNGTIVNADIATNAAIAGTKLENSGVTAGTYGSSSAIPIVVVDAQGLVTGASTTAIDSTKIQNGTSEVSVANNANITIKRGGTNIVNVSGGGIGITGDMSITGTVDGVDVAALKTSKDSLSTSNGVILNTVTASSTHAQSENSNKLATTAYVRTAISEAQAFPSGTKMIFQQTSAPTGWTKVTSSVDNKALRVVSGTAGSGGSNAFTNTLASRGINANAGNTTQGGNVSVSVANTTAGGNVSVANTTAGGNVSISSVSTSGTVNSHTLSTNEMPSHSHNIPTQGLQDQRGNAGSGNSPARLRQVYNNTTGSQGGNGGHSHGFSGSSHNHTGSLSGTAHNHNASFSGSAHNHNANASFSGSAHNHSISVGNLDMAVQYLDVIIASKN